MADVHLDALDQHVERAARKMELGDQRCQRPALPGLQRSAIERRCQLVPPARQFGRGGVGGRPRSFVHGIVHGAAEIPDTDDRTSLVRRQHQERVIEIRIARH